MEHQFARIFSAQPHNLSGSVITVEVDISRGLHAFSIVGLPDKSVEESRDRVGSALKHANVSSPKHHNEKTIVSLAPADLKKQGVYFDLAIAIAYLVAKGELTGDFNKTLFIGELSLNGELRPVTGIIALSMTAKESGFTTLIVPAENAEEASIVKDLTILGAQKLTDVINHFNTTSKFQIEPKTKENKKQAQDTSLADFCFSEIKGQVSSKRALIIAAAGGHNALLYGPPGTGKSMLAKAFSGILPPLSNPESLEVTSIHSIAGKNISNLITNRPFESPHHTSSHVAILGGGSNPKPGAITLAHHGVLFLDEFPEFDRRVLEGLRQPLEDRVVHIARSRSKASFPANIILIAAMNPPDPNSTPSDIRRLERKLSGPIVDRIDLWTAVEHVDYSTLTNKEPSGESSENIRLQVISARKRQIDRQSDNEKGWPTKNSELKGKHIDQLPIDSDAREILNQSAKKLKLSPRSYHRVIKVAQTISDLNKNPSITSDDILESLSYRNKKDAATTPYRIS